MAVSGAVSVAVPLAATARSVGRARSILRDALLQSGADELVDSATLVTSEIVTNALVHAGTDVLLRVLSTANAVRVEVEDGGGHVPVRRHYAQTAGTGRGMQLIDELSDRWGVDESVDGKAVWFEIGDLENELLADGPRGSSQHREEAAVPRDAAVRVTLRRVPLLMHVAWQEHAASLLREYLLHVLDDDEDIFTKHAQASDAMSLLSEQLPVPVLPDEPDALMAQAIEPGVSAEEVVLRVAPEAVGCFAVLDELLSNAVRDARAGWLLTPATQPEIEEMRQWLCREVAQQADGNTQATPWFSRTDVRAPLADQAQLAETYAGLETSTEPLLATDEASIIVAASAAALELLGYERVQDLVGRRVIVVVPERFHQAHVAGTTLHATNGRSNLLGVPIVVPMVRADGSEMPVCMEVRPELLDDVHRVFVARFQPVGSASSA